MFDASACWHDAKVCVSVALAVVEQLRDQVYLHLHCDGCKFLASLLDEAAHDERRTTSGVTWETSVPSGMTIVMDLKKRR